MKFRELKADEIEVRISTVSEKGCSVLLYKNARCDMNILDECVGPMNWQRDHKELKGNMYAGIGILDLDHGWVWKWDCGSESNTEAEKGEASDSFKRAGFNWGIGRELYTAPFIWFGSAQLSTLKQIEYQGKKKWTCSDSFRVDEIEYENGKISYLKITDTKSKAMYVNGKSKALNKNNVNDRITAAEVSEIEDLVSKANVNKEKLLSQYGIDSFEMLNMAQYTALKQKIEKAIA